MRPPSVFVRALSGQEATRLKRVSRRGRYYSTRQRAMIVLASATGMRAAQVAQALSTDESQVRGVIHEFNQDGFESLFPNWRGGRRRRITADQRRLIVAVAGARPDVNGVALTRWSLPRLSRSLAERALVVASPVQLGRILAEAGLSFQRTRSWKASPDPEYEAKAARVLALYQAPPPEGVVISFDELGPIGLCPHHGAGWAPRGRPARLRATYNRRHGIRYLIGCYDVHADYLRARLRPTRNRETTLTAMKTVRLASPRRMRIHWIQDGLSCHWTPDIRAWAAAPENNFELVPTPTYASYLNRIECHFFPITEFVLKNADYLDWQSLAAAMARHIQLRNDPAERDHRLQAATRRRLVAIAA
jgi:transposase